MSRAVNRAQSRQPRQTLSFTASGRFGLGDRLPEGSAAGRGAFGATSVDGLVAAMGAVERSRELPRLGSGRYVDDDDEPR